MKHPLSFKTYMLHKCIDLVPPEFTLFYSRQIWKPITINGRMILLCNN